MTPRDSYRYTPAIGCTIAALMLLLAGVILAVLIHWGQW